MKFYGDGDSKRFSTTKNTYPGITVQKYECLGHVQKQVCCRLQNLKKEEKVLSVKGKLTNNMIDRLQNYSDIAIRSNKNNLKEMQSATKAALFHVASNNQDSANGTINYKTDPGLPIFIVLKLRPIFEELNNEDLLKKCLHGITQNTLMFRFHNSNWVLMMLLQILILAEKPSFLYLRN